MRHPARSFDQSLRSLPLPLAVLLLIFFISLAVILANAPPVFAQEFEPPPGQALAPCDPLAPPVTGKPILCEPADNATPSFTPTFRWTRLKDAAEYRLEYTTDPTCSFGAGNTTVVYTKNVTFTPTKPFPNDVNYCWRVQANFGSTVSPWSDTREFVKRWYFQPELLTPTNSFQYVRDPLMSWSPVPGAARYKVEVSPANSFPPPNPGWSDHTSNPFYNRRDKALGGTWYWRVTPIDDNNNEGKPSQVSSFVGVFPYYVDYPVPQLAYPLYYFQPLCNLPDYSSPERPPCEDRSIPLPIFQWKRVLTGPSQEQAEAYRVEVSDDPAFLGSPDWTLDTQNLSAVPTNNYPFDPAKNVDYYWRVCVLDHIGGSCLLDPGNSLPMWSEIWKTRFNDSLPATAEYTAAPVLLRPADGYEAVESAPLLEWTLVNGASSYQVQIGTDPGFADQYLVDQASVPYPAYTPLVHLNNYPDHPPLSLEYGTYYWRVRAAGGGWSPTGRFQVAAQSHWTYVRRLGDPANRWQFGEDLDDGAVADAFELVDLNASQSTDYWYLGFHAGSIAPAGNHARIFALYLDLDHKANSGGTFDPRGNAFKTISIHRPEYVIYILEGGSPLSFSANSALVYKWDAAQAKWGPGQGLLTLGGNMLPPTLFSVSADASSNVFSAGLYGNIYHWDGAGWSPYSNAYSEALYTIAANDSLSQRWAMGANGLILQWDSVTSSWKKVNSPTNYQLNNAEIVAANLAVAAGNNGTIIRWKGTSWGKDSFANTSFNKNVYAVSMVKPAATDGWAVGESGTILHYTPVSGPLKWQEVTSPTAANLRAVVTLSGTESWAAGDSGTILRRTNANWEIVSTPNLQSLRSIAMLSSTSGWAVGLNGTILRWDGSTWESFTSPTTNHLYGISMLSESEGWIVGDKGTNLFWNGSSWTPIEDPLAEYIELLIPSTAIGMEAKTGSAAVSLFSVDQAGAIKDILPPANPNTINRFASLSERMNIIPAPANGTSKKQTVPSILPFMWSWPDNALWEGYRIETSLDPEFTTINYSVEVTSLNAPYLAAALNNPDRDLVGDNTYYWRVRPQYYHPQLNPGGAYSLPGSFERLGLKSPESRMQVTLYQNTPTFNWERVEGAATYDIQMDDDKNFGSPLFTVTTAQNSYTPTSLIPDGKYWWRVRVIRYGNLRGDWTLGYLVIETVVAKNRIYLPAVIQEH